MRPVHFEGSKEIKKPANMTDEQCSSIWAASGVDDDGFPYVLTAWKPNYEDLKALNEGRPIYVKTICRAVPPMVMFTMDENDNPNF